MSSSQRIIYPWVRVLIALSGVIVIFFLSHHLTGSFIPKESKSILIFQNALLLIVLGSSIVEFKYTTPSEAIMNGLFCLISLFTVYEIAEKLSWWLVFSFCSFIFINASICTLLSSTKDRTGLVGVINDFTYKVSTYLGKSKIIFSIVFLYGLISFYSIESQTFLVLTLFWGIYIVIWPLGLPELISKVFKRSRRVEVVGEVISIDHPNILRAILKPNQSWNLNNIKIHVGPDHDRRYIIPLYSQFRENKLLGTGYISSPIEEGDIENVEIGKIYSSKKFGDVGREKVVELLGGDASSNFVGFIREDSSIGKIRFEVIDSSLCIAGALVWCMINDKKVFYQISEGFTWEETLESERHGFQIAEASQLGILDERKGFIKHDWLPYSNTPVFVEGSDFGENLLTKGDKDFSYGKIRGTKLDVLGNIVDNIEYHTAILGVTGSGKTELTFDIIRDVLSNGTKVICIDLTNKYSDSLKEQSPTKLSLGPENIQALSEKIFDADTGDYGAGKEKKILKDYSQSIKEDVEEILESFLYSETENLGIISLEEISNTKTTLHITEIYLSTIFNKAKYEDDKFPKLLVVVEEAHTVMPESTTMGLDDYDSKALVGKISQIALQGRKYGIGLLTLSQRTATVSKSVLTQCNTIISFTCYDDTSLNFLRNIYGSDYVKLIPNMGFLQAIVFGKAVRSERPIIVDIPYVEHIDLRVK
jgi:hypothetical protein